MQSIEEVLKRIFSIDLNKLIWETPIDAEEGIEWLRNFNQTPETLREYVSEAGFDRLRNIRYDYEIKDKENMDKVIEELSVIQNMVGIIFPVIAGFTNSLCGERIVGGIKRAKVQKEKVREHQKIIEKYLNCEKLRSAVEDWDKVYASWLTYRKEQRKKSNDPGGGWYNDGRLRTLVQFNNDDSDTGLCGNIFKNLLEALEQYNQFLLTDFKEDDFANVIGLGELKNTPF